MMYEMPRTMAIDREHSNHWLPRPAPGDAEAWPDIAPQAAGCSRGVISARVDDRYHQRADRAAEGEGESSIQMSSLTVSAQELVKSAPRLVCVALVIS